MATSKEQLLGYFWFWLYKDIRRLFCLHPKDLIGAIEATCDVAELTFTRDKVKS